MNTVNINIRGNILNSDSNTIHDEIQKALFLHHLDNCIKSEKSICDKAIETFGVISQLDQAQEEAAELIVSISKYKRSLQSKDFEKIQIAKSEILTELADNKIMHKQLMLILGYSKDDLRLVIKSQLKKLLGYIENSIK